MRLISVEDHLPGEPASLLKHEYLGGVVYAKAGERIAHNIIATNALVALGSRLRGRPGRLFNSDTKVRVQMPTYVRFYYPDAQVVCRSNPVDYSYQDEPAVIVEVLSRGTRRLDEGEKKDAYLTIPSLGVYLLVEQDMPAAVVYRRTEQGFAREVYEGLDAVIALPEIDTELPLAELFEAVDFLPEPVDDEAN